ncbi:uncharacterized protein [Clytia hemisphaerica]
MELKFFTFLLLIPFSISAQAQFYITEEDITFSTTSNENGEAPSTAVSSTECILKCKTTDSSTTAYFVEEVSKCFCLVNETQDIFSNDITINGTLYKPEPKMTSCGQVKDRSRFSTNPETGFYTLDKDNVPTDVFCDFTNQGKPSCKHLKEFCPTCASGFYTFEIENELNKVYCEMDVDGGGWLMFGNLEIIPDATSLDSANDAVQNPSSISELQNVQSGSFYLAPTELQKLYKSSGYSEMRIMCYKKWHMRTLDVVLTGLKFVDWMVSGFKKTGLCGDVRFLPMDDSFTSVQACSGLKFGGIHLIYEPNRYHVVLGYHGTKWSCDDSKGNAGYTTAGKWELYVR